MAKKKKKNTWIYLKVGNKMAFTLLSLSDSVQLTCASIAGVIFQSWVSPEVEPWCSQAPLASKPRACSHGRGLSAVLPMVRVPGGWACCRDTETNICLLHKHNTAVVFFKKLSKKNKVESTLFLCVAEVNHWVGATGLLSGGPRLRGKVRGRHWAFGPGRVAKLFLLPGGAEIKKSEYSWYHQHGDAPHPIYACYLCGPP